MATTTSTSTSTPPKKPPITASTVKEPPVSPDDLKQDIPEKKKLSPSDRKLAEDITQIYGTIGLAVGSIGMLREDAGLTGTGQKIIEKSDTLAENWLELANTNAKIKSTLKKITESSAWGSVIIGHAVCLMPLLADRGVIPSSVAEMIQ